MGLVEQVSYLRGLAEGSNLTDSNHGKFFDALLDTLEEISDSIEEIEENFADLEEFAMSIDEDLTELEEEFYADLDWDAYDELENEDYELSSLSEEDDELEF